MVLILYLQQPSWKGQLMHKMLSHTLHWDAECLFPCPAFCFDPACRCLGCLLWEAMNCPGTAADDFRWLQNGGKPHCPPNQEPGRGACGSSAQTCLGKGVSHWGRRHQRRPVKRHKKRCKRTHVRAHGRRHKKEM